MIEQGISDLPHTVDVTPGRVYQVAVYFPESGAGGPTSGTLEVFHDESNSFLITVPVVDEFGSEYTLVADGTKKGISKTIVAESAGLTFNDPTSGLVGSGFLISVMPVY